MVSCGRTGRGDRGLLTLPVIALFGVLLVLVASASARTGAQARPDLVVRSLQNPPATLAPGAALTSRFTIANRGLRTAGRSTARAYLSRDSRKGKGDVLLRPASSVPSLKPGKAVRRTGTVRIPSATATGLWFLIVCSDDTRRVRETNERNNCRRSARGTSVVETVKPPPLPPPPPPPAPSRFSTR